MKAIGDVMQTMFKARQRNLTRKQKEMAEWFYEVVTMWKNGELTLKEVEQQTWSGWVRAQIIFATPNTHPLHNDIMALLDALIMKSRGLGFDTPGGWITEEMIQSHYGKLEEVVDPYTGAIELVPVYPVGFNKTFEGQPDFNSPRYPIARLYRPPEEEEEETPDAVGKREWIGERDAI